jgi:hypothetical protein
MSSCTIIVSSKCLCKALIKREWFNWDDKGEAEISITGNKFVLTNAEVSLDVECKGEGEFSYPNKTLKRLRKLCAAIQDQPISLTFSSNDIKIHPPVFI